MAEFLGDLEGFLSELRRRAQQRALHMEGEARKQIEQIVQQAEEQARDLTEEVRRQTEKQSETLGRRMLAQGEAQVQRRLLTSREVLLERVWQEVETRLRSLVATPAYVEVLRRIACEAAQALEGKRITLAADPHGHTLLTPDRLATWGQAAGVDFVLAPRPADTWGGLLARCERIQYDGTFPTRLSLAREALREEAFRALTAP